MTKTHDVIVIGSGGGTKIAKPAAAMGLKVAFIEEGAAGGTCLNRGCIPSKMLIYPTELADHIRQSSRLDVDTPVPPVVHFGQLVERISHTVDNLSHKIEADLAATPNIDYYRDHAAFVSDKAVRVGDTILTADRIFVATGSVPRIPALPGLANTPFMTSTDALRRIDLPEQLIVIGAGYIAVELGGAYRAAGSHVQFIVRSRLLRQEDSDISEAFAREFARHHTIHKGHRPTAVRWNDGTFSVTCRDHTDTEQKVTGDALLVATGIRPNTAALGLEHTGIRTDDNGFIRVDDHLRTTVDGVYALGDVAGNYLFRHTVNHEGEYLVRTAFSESPAPPIDYGPVPHAVFGHPQVAGVGATEEEAAASGWDYIVGRADYADSTPGMARRSDHGLVKILVDRSTHTLLGAHILGDEASDMIHLFIVLMKKRGTLDDLLDMIFIHPALPEVARDAARDARSKL